MKKMLLFSLITIAFLLTGCKHRTGRVPEAVLQAFETIFPDASHVEWAEHLSVYMADFYHDGHEKHAQFDSTDTWLRTRTRMSIYEVPVPVIEAARKYSYRIIDDVYLFEQSNGAAAYYMVEYKQDTPFSTKQINILANGTILSAF